MTSLYQLKELALTHDGGVDDCVAGFTEHSQRSFWRYPRVLLLEVEVQLVRSLVNFIQRISFKLKAISQKLLLILPRKYETQQWNEGE